MENRVFGKHQSASHDCPLTRGGQQKKDEKGKTAGVRGEGRVGDGGVETKQRQDDMKRFLSGKGEAGKAGGRQRPVTQRYTKIHKEKEGRVRMDGSETQSE